MMLANWLLKWKNSSNLGGHSLAPTKPAAPVKTFNSYRPDPTSKEDKDKGRVKEASKSLKKCFKCHGYGHFLADCPNRRVIIIREIEDLDQMKVEEDEEESDEEGETSYLPLKEGEMLMIKRVLHATKAPPEASQGEQIFHLRCKVAKKNMQSDYRQGKLYKCSLR